MTNYLCTRSSRVLLNIEKCIILSSLNKYKPYKILSNSGLNLNQHIIRYKTTISNDISSIVQPVAIKPVNDTDGVNVGEELSGVLKKGYLK